MAAPLLGKIVAPVLTKCALGLAFTKFDEDNWILSE